MLRIAICDDDENICRDMEAKLKKTAVENNYINDCAFKIKSFYSVNDLYKYFHINEDAFDLIFLDIKFEENGMAGVEMGNTIRKRFLNETIKIVYISNFTDYAMDLFQIQPFNFFIKPVSYEKINETVSAVLRIMNKQNKPFIYINKGIEKNIDLFKVLYFVNHGRKIEIVTLKKQLENDAFYGKISELGKELAKSDFFFIHRSYLVNYHNVSEFQYKSILMLNGDKLNISQSYSKESKGNAK